MSVKSSVKITPDLAQYDSYTVIGMFPWDERVSEVAHTKTACEAEWLFNPEADRIAGVVAGSPLVDPEEVYSEPRPYTVIAYYRDNGQRYGALVHACSAAEAEQQAIDTCNEDNGFGSVDPWGDAQAFDADIIIVCGVIEGVHACQDVYSGGEESVYERPSKDDLTYEQQRRGL
jgi:hypothetical protein